MYESMNVASHRNLHVFRSQILRPAGEVLKKSPCHYNNPFLSSVCLSFFGQCPRNSSQLSATHCDVCCRDRKI